MYHEILPFKMCVSVSQTLPTGPAAPAAVCAQAVGFPSPGGSGLSRPLSPPRPEATTDSLPESRDPPTLAPHGQAWAKAGLQPFTWRKAGGPW